MDINEIIRIALKAGELMLVSGAEVYRVEDTIITIFSCYNIECECFVLLTGIFICVKDIDLNDITVFRGIKEHNFDLKRMELVNSFSRNLNGKLLSYEDASNILEGIENAGHYKLGLRLAAAAVTAFTFSMLFEGSLFDSLAASIISIIVYYLKEKISKLGFFQFFEYFISGALVGILSIAAVKIFPGFNIYKIIIGSVMILLPGLAITSGIKDALYGDTVSSIYRIAEAVFIVTAVGLGVGIILSVGLNYY